MKLIVGILLTAISMLAGCATAPDGKSRFVVENHVILRDGTPHTIVLKVDTAEGRVWQYDSRSGSSCFNLIEIQDATTEANRGCLRASERLQRITIPEVAWTNTPIWEVIDFLRSAAMQHDPEYNGMRDQLTEYDRSFVQFTTENWRTNALINPFALYDNWRIFDASPSGASDPFAADNGLHSDDGTSATSALPRVTFQAREITMQEARILVAKAIGYNSRLHPDGFTILPHNNWCPHWELFPVPMGIARNKNWHSFLKQHGVDVESAARVVYSTEHQTLAIYATPYNLQLCRELMDRYVTHEGHQAGRYRLVASDDGSGPLVLLIDDLTGRTWRYAVRPFTGADGTEWEAVFEFISE